MAFCGKCGIQVQSDVKCRLSCYTKNGTGSPAPAAEPFAIAPETGYVPPVLPGKWSSETSAGDWRISDHQIWRIL